MFGGNFCQCETRPALFGIGVVGQIPDAAPAVAATLWQVRVLGWEEPFIDAGVEAEDGGLVVAEPVELGGGFLSLADGLPAVGERVLALVDLHGRAAAPPSVGREIGSPEGVVGGKGDAVQCGVFLADAAVGRGAVLEVVAAFPGLDVLPFGGHLGGGDGELVLAFEPVAVVGVVNLQDILLEPLVGFQFPGLVAQGQSGLAELVVDLESGEHEGVVVELAGHGLGDFVAGDAEFLGSIRLMCSQEKRRGLFICKIRFAFR